MTRLTTPLLTLALILMCLCFSNIRAQAEVIPGHVGEYVPPDGLNIDPGNTALEIMGGSVIAPDISCPGGVKTTRESLVILNQNDPNNLNVRRLRFDFPAIEVDESQIPVTPNVFGLTRNMYTRGDGRIFGSFIDDGSFTTGGKLTSIWSDDGLNYDTVEVNPGFGTYGSSTTAPLDFDFIASLDPFNSLGNNAHPCVGGPNLDNDKYEIFCSPDSGAFWFFAADSTELVLAALNGGTVSTFGPNGNENFWIFYGSLTGVSYDLRVTDTATGITKTFDTDEPGNTLADSCGVSTPKGNAVIYRNRSEGNIK